jgi:Tfp pilus assembly protein PilO
MTKEKTAIIIKASIAVVVVGLYLFLYRPLINQLKASANKCKTIEAQVLQSRKTVSFLRTMPEKKSLINEGEVSFVIDELTKQGKSKDINFVYIKPGKMEKSADFPSGCKVLPLEMEIESSYVSLGKFLGALDNLEKGVVTVKSFYVYPEKNYAERLKTKLVLNIYIKTDG